MQAPTWFDLKYGAAMSYLPAEQCMAQICSDDKVLQAVKDALTLYDSQHPLGFVAGSSRCQVVRGAIARALEAP
jgi:hypothetical protein